jgi:heat shock protein HslJ
MNSGRLLMLLVSCALVGCGSSQITGGATAPTSPSSSPEAGRTYLSTEVTGHELVANTTISISFDTSGALAARAGCNSIGGSYSVANATLNVGALSQTDMGCAPELMSQDDWIVSLLTTDPTFTVDADTLVISGPTGSITMLDKKTAQPDASLVGNRWLVDTIIQGEVASTPPQGAAGSILFGSDGTLTASLGCNTGSAQFTVSGDTITIGAMATTRMACFGEAAELEKHMLAALTGVVQFAIDGDALTLTAESGAGLGLQLEQHP